jgi:uncharacterized protein (TIGR03000 family)
MCKGQRFVTVALLTAAAVLLLADPCSAQFRRLRPANRPIHQPGWDWWRIYPWSPYNYGRNPYNPAWVPYPVPYPYSYVRPYPVYTPAPYASYAYDTPPSTSITSIPGASYTYGAADADRQVLVPDPSGPLRTPPLDAAVIRLYVPDPNATVWFNGVKTSSIGTTRYYVTPDLPQGKPYHYEIRARWNRGNESMSEQRAISVSPGKTAVVDFNKPA